MEITRVSEESMRDAFMRILLKTGYDEKGAKSCAEIFTLNSLEGVYSHGVNRFPRFVKNTMEGFIKPLAVPSLVHRFGSVEQWDGNLGPGPLNAVFATDRSTALALENGIGMVALANTNHWMRAGTYGKRAARNGFALICWTNTCPNMPAWGARDPRLGNNPFVIAVPGGEEPIVLDFAMTQFSYGKMEHYRNTGSRLPFPGGYSTDGRLTDDPSEILESWRPLPAGYWKGSSLSLLLDILAAILSGGRSVHEVKTCSAEYGVSQVFIAINLETLNNSASVGATIGNIIDDVRKSVPSHEGSEIRYPGEHAVRIRKENLEQGIPVEKRLWDKISSLL